MLPRHYRLPAKVRFMHAQIDATAYFTVKYVPNNLSQSRFGFIIGKAVAKQAVIRNRARRVLRSCIEERLERIAPGYDMLFLLKKGIIDKDRETLSSEIEKLLSDKKLFKDIPNT